MRRRPCSRAPPNSNPSAPTPTRPEIRASPGRQAHLSHTDADADALLWAARSAVACPGCPWDRGLARWLRASPPMVVHPGSTQLSGFEVRFLVSGPRGRKPLLLRGFGLALRPLAASPPTPSPPTPRRRRQLHRRRRRRRRRPLAAAAVAVATPTRHGEYRVYSGALLVLNKQGGFAFLV